MDKSPELGNSENAGEGTWRHYPLVLEGSRKKIDSCSSFPVLLTDIGEVGAQEEGTDQKGEKKF